MTNLAGGGFVIILGAGCSGAFILPGAVMRTPSLTVLMTVYNGMPYLKEAVGSILSQDCTDFTFLILNNGSEDGTPAFLEELRQKHGAAQPRLLIEHLPANIGRTAVLNKGLALVASEIVAVMDADDIAAPGRISRQMAFFRDNPGIDLVGADISYIDGTGNRIGEEHFPVGHDDLRDRLPLFNQFAHSACAFRAEAAHKAGGYDARFPYAQDLALWVAMLAGGSRAASIPEPLAGIRCHPGQVTRDLALLTVRAWDNHRLAEAMLDIPGLAPASRQAACLRSALALWRLKRRRQAIERAWSGFRQAPLRFFFNPVLWRRLALELRRIRGKS